MLDCDVDAAVRDEVCLSSLPLSDVPSCAALARRPFVQLKGEALSCVN